MQDIEYDRMGHEERHYWWHKGKLHLARSIYKQHFKNKKNIKILEIGCGTGEVLNLLSQFGDAHGIDISPKAVEYCKNRGIEQVTMGDINNMDLSNHLNTFDFVLVLDVLEHIQDDVETLKRINTLLKPGGILLVTVPAYKFLWSNHDEALHHKRRYHSLELRTKLADTGFEIKKLSHYVATLFPPIAVVRFASNFIRRKAYAESTYVHVPDTLNNLFTKILEIESILINKMYLPFGTTLVAVAHKPK